MAFGDVLRSWALPGSNPSGQGVMRRGPNWWFHNGKSARVDVMDVLSFMQVRSIGLAGVHVPVCPWGDYRFIIRATGGFFTWDPNNSRVAPTQVVSHNTLIAGIWTGAHLVTTDPVGMFHIYAPPATDGRLFTLVRCCQPQSYAGGGIFTLGWDGRAIFATVATPRCLVIHDPAANYTVVKTGPAPANDSITSIVPIGSSLFVAVGGATNRLYEVSRV